MEAREDALARFGRPEIFNTDQGSQFTAEALTQLLLDRGIKISMDGEPRRAGAIRLPALRVARRPVARGIDKVRAPNL